MSHFERLESYLPLDLTDPANFMIAWLVVFGFIVLRYFAAVGIFYGIFWWRPSKRLKRKALYSITGKSKQVHAEILWSLVTSVIFAFSGVATGLLWQMGWTRFYLSFDEYPFWYLPLSLLLFSLVHEIYFYATHFWMHRPRVYKFVHYVHHLSREPSPWASFSFHPLEGLIEAAILPLLVLLIPIHPVMFIIYMTAMTLSAINNHLGYELMPRPIRRFLISGENHSRHHRFSRHNYGLYYTFMDRIFGTLKS